MKKNHIYRVSFRCYYEENKVTHYQELPLTDIPKWVEAYRFTHPEVLAISVRINFVDRSLLED